MPKANKNPLARKWVGTVYKWKDGSSVDENSRFDWPSLSAHLRYLAYQVERCPDTGRIHLQYYCEAKKQYRRKGIQDVMGYSGYCEESFCPDGAAEYPLKEDSRVHGPWTFGTRAKYDGQRTDLAEVCEAVEAGADLQEIGAKFPMEFIKFHKGIERWIALRNGKARALDEPPQVICIVGPPGTGKTSKVFSAYKPHEIYNVRYENGFFNGYANQPVVLFDDFDPGQVKWNHLLQLLDRYPMTANVKGSFCEWNPQVVVITNNQPPDTWYLGEGRDTLALIRRFSQIWQVRNGEYTDTKSEFLPAPIALIPFNAACSLPPLRSSAPPPPVVAPPAPIIPPQAADIEIIE